MKNKKIVWIIALLTIFISVASCLQGSPIANKGTAPLTIGLMPAVDAAPIFVALKNGYFDELNLKVDVQVYTNAVDRQSALQSGEIDGTISDLISLINNVSNGFDIKATTTTDSSFPVIVRNGFDEASAKAIVGLMEVSVVNYLADEYLAPKYTLDKIYINDIPARIEMLKSGQIDMAVLPEPMASQAELQGLKKVVYENKDSYSLAMMAFTGKALNEKSDSILLFHKAYNKAVDFINGNESFTRDTLIEKLNINPDTKDLIALPIYKHAQVPDDAFVQKVIDWTSNTLGQKIDLTYEQLIDTRFVQ
ncbi:MAG: ABC transporter substrate-binding protein [Oscillospiraceae bacterium]|nr:ABC transporter substrate-binding protein [Oscillospiraceae bacterium]